MDKESMAFLETMVDRFGVLEVLRSLGTICSEKSVRIAENWQDTKTAKVWMGQSSAIDAVVARLEK